MKQKIVIITSKYLHPFVEKAFEDFKEDCTVTIADYTNFDHITDIYRKYEKTADAERLPWQQSNIILENFRNQSSPFMLT